jgi:pyruvate/2-oxoglutarate/acetoin dehydrogenase E1 component
MTIDFRTAIREAIASEMERDESVILFGEDIAAAGGVFNVTPGLYERFGEERVFDTPISELALAGAAFGAALAGKRPIVEIMFGDFMALPMDSLVNQAAKYWYLSNEQHPVPLVVRSAVGAGGRFGAIHSQNPATWFMGIAGLKVVCPAFPADAQTLLCAAIRDDNPVLFLEHKRLYSTKADPRAADGTELGRAVVVRSGADVTVVSCMKGVHDSLAAADALAVDGIELEVIDLRSLRPLDVETVLESVERTNRLVCVEEGPLVGGWAAGLAGIVTQRRLEDLDDVLIVTTDDTPVPYSPPLEDAFLPDADTIATTIRERLGASQHA